MKFAMLRCLLLAVLPSSELYFVYALLFEPLRCTLLAYAPKFRSSLKLCACYKSLRKICCSTKVLLQSVDGVVVEAT